MRSSSVRNLTMAAMMTALTAICSQIVIPLPFTPVFFNLAVFAVLLCGALLPPGWAAASQLCYLLLGVMGVPVFGQFRAGPGVLVGPTGGYAMAYPVMALLVAALIQNRRGASWRVAACVVGILPCYLLGTLWLAVSANLSLWSAFMGGVAPFIIPDIAKATLAGVVALRVKRVLQASHA